MTDKKLVDNEVIRALGRISCKTLDDCKLINNAIDLCNSQNAEIKKLEKFKSYFDSLYGTGLEVLNWHQNGNTISFDEFYDSAIDEMEGNNE